MKMQWDFKDVTVNVDMYFMQIVFNVGAKYLQTRRVHGAVCNGKSRRRNL